MVVKTQKRGERTREAILKFVGETEIEEPTIRQIASAVGKSISTTHRHVRILVERGDLRPV